MAFVKFLWEMLSDPAYAHVFTWNNEGTAFTVRDWRTLQQDIFPRYFSCQWVSFRTYFSKAGFARAKKYWSHPDFTRDNPRLQCIKMKQGRKESPSTDEDSYTAESDLSDTSESSESPVSGYTCNFQYTPLEPGTRVAFCVDGSEVPATPSTLRQYRNSLSTVCIRSGKDRYQVHGARLHTEDPRTIDSICTVFAYQQGTTKMRLQPEDSVVYCYRGQWCQVVTMRDVQIAQKQSARTYIVRPGDCFSLPPGTHLYFREELTRKRVYRVPQLEAQDASSQD